MHLSESLAGVTLLAFGNGAPDILASIIDPDKDSEMMFTEVFGGGLFVICVIGGILAIIKPFYIIPNTLLRDLFFLVIAIFTVLYCSADEFYLQEEAIGTLALYFIYIAVVIIGHIVQKRLRQKKKQDAIIAMNIYSTFDLPGLTGFSAIKPELQARIDKMDEQFKFKLKSGKRESSAKDIEDMRCASISPIIEPANHGLVDYFLKSLSMNGDEDTACYSKALKMIEVPTILMFKLIIPEFDLTIKRHGWNKLLNIINLLILPQLLMVVLLCKL